MTRKQITEAARALVSRRKHHRGGPAPSCKCGKCAKCLNRAYMREYRKRKKGEAK